MNPSNNKKGLIAGTTVVAITILLSNTAIGVACFIPTSFRKNRSQITSASTVHAE